MKISESRDVAIFTELTHHEAGVFDFKGHAVERGDEFEKNIPIHEFINFPDLLDSLLFWECH